MQQLRSVFVFSYVVLMGLIASAPCWGAVVLHTEVEVNRATVRLSDVFDGLPDGIDREIARSPAPGKSITYDVNVLTHLASDYKLDWQPQNLTDHTVVKTASNKVLPDTIRAAVVEKVKALAVKGDVDVAFDNHIMELNLPADRPPTFALNNFEYDAINKRFRADLMADNFNGPFVLPVIGHITVRHTVPVLAHRLESGTIIGVNDIDWLSVPEDRGASIVTNAEQLIGHELRREVDADQPLHEHDVIPPRMVVRGTLVTMKIETPLMIVTAQGRALQDGKLGDIVRVTNTQSNRTIEGMVDGIGVVRIATAQKLASAESAGKQE